MVHIEVKLTIASEEISNILIAMLSELHYEGFEEEGSELKAYISQSLFDKDQLEEVIRQFEIQYRINELPDTNWNNVWESNFKPVVVEDFCAIRADFHAPFKNVKHEIVITPKMSFGTGHHATTFMMIRQMEAISFRNKNIIDFGTGTGVLAILAEKLGGVNIVAIDNDDWSIANAEENFKNNNTKNIRLRKADTADTDGIFEIILANITRNVILDNFSSFMSQLANQGILLLSGLLSDDEDHILKKAKEYHLILEKKMLRENWISLKFRK